MSIGTNTESRNFDFTLEEQEIKLVFSTSKRKKTRKINIQIEGSFTLKNAELVNEKIQPVFSDFDHVDVILRNISQIDLAAVQLLYLFKKTQSGANKTINVDAELSHEDRSSLFNSGLMGLLTKPKLTE